MEKKEERKEGIRREGWMEKKEGRKEGIRREGRKERRSLKRRMESKK